MRRCVVGVVPGVIEAIPVAEGARVPPDKDPPVAAAPPEYRLSALALQ